MSPQIAISPLVEAKFDHEIQELQKKVSELRASVSRESSPSKPVNSQAVTDLKMKLGHTEQLLEMEKEAVERHKNHYKEKDSEYITLKVDFDHLDSKYLAACKDRDKYKERCEINNSKLNKTIKDLREEQKNVSELKARVAELEAAKLESDKRVKVLKSEQSETSEVQRRLQN